MSSPAWSTLRIASVTPQGDELTSLVLELTGTPLVGTHARPGQYTQVRQAEGAPAGTFAIASPPGAGPHWELLLRGGSALPDALARLRPGDTVQALPARGPGFPLEESRGKDLVLVGTGSGIAPLRSVLGALARERQAWGEVTLFFGARRPQSFAYVHELETWRALGVRVVRTVSTPGHDGWEGLTGYVQEHLGENLTRARLSHAVAFLCGQTAMVQGVTDALVAHGMPRGSVFLNH